MNLENKAVSLRLEVQGRLVKVSSHIVFRRVPDVQPPRGKYIICRFITEAFVVLFAWLDIKLYAEKRKVA